MELQEERPAGWYTAVPAPGYERYWTGTEWAGIRPIDTFPIKPSPVLSAAVIAQPRERKSRWPWIAGSIIAFFIALFTIGVTIAAAGEADKVELSDKPTTTVEEVQPPTEPIELPEQFDRQHPHPAGYVATITDLDENPLYTVSARLVEADATASVAAANPFNELAPAGFRYVLVEYTVTGLSPDAVAPLVAVHDWQVVAENGAVASIEPVVPPGTGILESPDLYEGQFFVGQAVYVVPVEAATLTFCVFGLYVTL